LAYLEETEALVREVEDGEGRQRLSRSEEEPRAATLERERAEQGPVCEHGSKNLPNRNRLNRDPSVNMALTAASALTPCREEVGHGGGRAQMRRR